METLELEPHEMLPGCRAPLRALADFEFRWAHHDEQTRRHWPEPPDAIGRFVRLRPGRFVCYVRRAERNFIVTRPDGAPQIWSVKPQQPKIERLGYRLVRGPSSWFGLASVLVLEPRAGQTRAPVALIEGLWGVLPDGSWGDNTSHVRGAWLDAEFARPVYFRFDRAPDARAELERAMGAGEPMEWAWRWINAAPAQRAEMWDVEELRRLELERLMRCVLWCLPELWAQCGRVSLSYSWKYVVHFWFHAWEAGSIRSAEPQFSGCTDALIAAWGKAFLCHFFPLQHLELLEFNSDLAALKPKMTDYIYPPTMHQRLEAQLEVRDWIARHAPNEMEQLLPPV